MTDASVDAATLQQLAGKLLELLKIRTLPIAMKQYTSREEMEKVKGLRWPMEGRRHTTCQLVTQSRMASLNASFNVRDPPVTGTTSAPSNFIR